MKTNITTTKRIRELFFNGLWIANTNYKALLKSVSMQQAINKYENLNTIADLTFHINYYLEGVLNALQDGSLDIHDKYSFDAPPIKTEKNWQKLVDKLLTNAENFASTVEQMHEEKLHATFINEKYGSNLRNIEAIIEHSYYHLGQISLINKLLSQK